MSSSTAAILYSLTVSVPPVSASPDEAKEKSHHASNGYVNPWDSWSGGPTFHNMMKFFGRHLTAKGHRPDTTPPTVPVQKPEFLPSRDTPGLRATWLGHACYYVEFPGGLRVLFDPVFEDRCSPISWLGPKRYTEMPCAIKDLPTIDAVVISHNHYDHLSYPTIKEIARLHPNCHFFAPLGNRQWFVDSGIHNVTELDWWEQRDISLAPVKEATPEVSPAGAAPSTTGANADIHARISCLPCQHTTNRGVFDRCKTLWASWSVESGGRKVYFAGDTGYRSVPDLPETADDHSSEYTYPSCPAFKQVGQHRGPFDLGLIPIGAYKPRFFMSAMHADPHDAVQIFQDTQCRRALGMHWGTWVLTEEDVLEPPKLLKDALRKHEIPEEGVFDVCDIGESREF
ncbi:Metallo-hydrolase/oxidoreductase [Aspergillus steynii IBT 23096]|uniref:Metallo-hydrolase/oxidoreductase n=1 Tax=Aspergillus steynii IBT 23096 TaxID=1392250 RepID=A0A2I2GJX5_9EURO|nr:Metallo-hydrolase/oxidoreductase [Aspergillus steynii IBT 23096]PLB53188.1 Metallo-hydrolase/oxidoreductase [Aspergillus steynii IBT 23096]